MDQMVKEVQIWVNDKYKNNSGYNVIEENGITGWSTMYALIRALQIELEIGSTANNFGEGTSSAYKTWGEMSMMV